MLTVMVIGVLIRDAHVAAARRKAWMTVNRFESDCNCERATRFSVKPVADFSPADLATFLLTSYGSRLSIGTPLFSRLGIVAGTSSGVAARQVALPPTI